MLISELIDHLEKAKSSHGDLVCLLSTSRSGDVTIESITKVDDPADVIQDGELKTVQAPFLLITAED
jgi:hypothetical protein